MRESARRKLEERIAYGAGGDNPFERNAALEKLGMPTEDIAPVAQSSGGGSGGRIPPSRGSTMGSLPSGPVPTPPSGGGALATRGGTAVQTYTPPPRKRPPPKTQAPKVEPPVKGNLKYAGLLAAGAVVAGLAYQNQRQSYDERFR